MYRSRILIADDHTFVADLCKRLLEAEFDVVGTVADGDAMVRMGLELRPDVIVADIAMPVLNGLDAAEHVKERFRAVKLIFLTMYDDPEVAAEAFRRGASGYLLKTCSASHLVTAVRSALRGMTYLSPPFSRDNLRSLRRQRRVAEGERLTERQREVLRLFAEGKEVKEIRSILHLTTRTVNFHKERIKKVLGAKTTSDLVRYAVRNRLIAA
jgi:DNA-binding NarL/FixJ family response regulator